MASDLRYPRITQRAAVLTDVGVIREHNEDAALVDPEGDFFIVADGMGGHAAGEVASAMAVQAVGAALAAARTEVAAFAGAPSEDGRKKLVGILEGAVRSAHQAVFERGSNEADKQGMGTTLDVLLIAGGEAFVAHVGDSRTYLVRDGKAAKITTDHTVAEVLVIEGKLSPEEAQISPLRTILVNAVGVAAEIGVEMAHIKLRKGDYLLLCSDGLHDYFPTEPEIAGVVSQAAPEQALESLVTIAKTRGGHDNITGVLVEVLEVPPAAGGDGDGEGDVAETKTGEHQAVPLAVGSEDTQPVALREALSGGRGPALRAAATTEPAPIATSDGDATTAEHPLPNVESLDPSESVTHPMAQLPARVKRGAKKPSKSKKKPAGESGGGDGPSA